MRRPRTTSEALSSGAFIALMASVATCANLSEQLPTTPTNLLVRVSSALEVSSFTELANEYGYRSTLESVVPGESWFLRLTPISVSYGSAPPPPPLDDCPGLLPLMPRTIVSDAFRFASSAARSIPSRLTRWWVTSVGT